METNIYIIESKRLPPNFNGFKIAHISDFHNAECAEELIDALIQASPDITVFTGDTVHRENEFESAKTLIDGIKEISPVYFVTGNHERAIKSFEEFKDYLISSGVKVLDNEFVTIERNGEFIAVIGINDPTFFEKKKTDYAVELDRLCSEATESGMDYKILLCHRPELFEMYVSNGIDLSLCGHTHGGHVRFPLIGALYAPGQGLFPKYSDGKYVRGSSTMIISRGLGKSRQVPRILNPPELVMEILRVGENEEDDKKK